MVMWVLFRDFQEQCSKMQFYGRNLETDDYIVLKIVFIVSHIMSFTYNTEFLQDTIIQYWVKNCICLKKKLIYIDRQKTKHCMTYLQRNIFFISIQGITY